MQSSTDKPKWIGYSNKVAYPVYKIMKNDPDIGLTEIEGWIFMVWCKFENIIKIKPMTTQRLNSTLKDIIEAQIIEQAINAKHEIQLNKEVETDSEAGTYSHEEIIDCENYNLFLGISYEVIGKVEPATYEQPSEDNRKLGIVNVDEIRLCPQDSDIQIELSKELENQLVESLKFV